MTKIGRYTFYLRYVFRHKWHVARHCFKHGIYLRGLTHDLSKFLPSEFFPYIRYWTKYGEKRLKDRHYPVPDDVMQPYKKAVRLHKQRNDHHPEYWLHETPNGELESIDMNEDAIMEMICDWEAFFTMFPGRKGAVEGYHEFSHKRDFSPRTRERLETLLRTLDLMEN